MTAPTLADVRAWLTNSLQWHEIARSAAAGPWAPPGTTIDHFPLAHDPIALHRLAIAALDDAERVEWLDDRAYNGGITLGWSDADSDIDENGRYFEWGASYWVHDESRAPKEGHLTLRAAIDAARREGA